MDHRFTFHRLGGLDQVALDTGEDLAHLRELDQKLWVALSCPSRGLEIDTRTLSLLDQDGDGRIRAPEILAALDWCKPRLRSLGELIPARDGLELASIDDGTPEGRALLQAARRILAGRPQAQLTCADVQDLSAIYKGTKLNGDGIVTKDSTDDAALSQAIQEAVDTVGGVLDRSGGIGVDRERVGRFFAELEAFAVWARGEVQPFGAETPALQAAFSALDAKAVDYFHRCRLAAYDPRVSAELDAAARLSDRMTAALPALPGFAPELRGLPLARVEAGRPLPLVEGVNPAWASEALSLSRLTGKRELREGDWEELRERLAPYAKHLAEKKGALVEKLGLPRVEALLASDLRTRMENLIAEDEQLLPESNAMADVAKLVHFRRDLHTLLCNFVNFTHFYDPQRSAVFQAGTLYLDSRSCDLSLRIDDPAAHAALGSLSHMYVAYCDCKRPTGETMKIAACFTQGDSDYLTLGRNGIFYDRLGRDWDATIVKIVDNPISLRQAFWSPYKKFMRLVEDTALRFAAAKEKDQNARMAALIEARPAAAAPGAPRAAPGAPPAAPGAPVVAAPVEPTDIGKMVGIIAALGVGVGALGTVFGALVAGFVTLQPWWAKLIAVAGALVAISGPSILLAFLKLRARTLGPLLDANGWAVNGRVKVNLVLGASLTGIKSLPPGSRRTLDDPFEDPGARRRRQAVIALVVAAVVLAWWLYVRRR